MKGVFAATGLTIAVFLSMQGDSSAATVYSTFMSQTAGCGTAVNKHLCVTLTKVQTNTAVEVAKRSVATNTDSETLATWSGTVECTVQGQPLSANHFEAEADIAFQLQSEGTPIDAGGPGGGSAGFRQTQPVAFIHRYVENITLTRLFEKPTALLRVLAKPTFKNGTNATCTVKGGQFTWTTVNKNTTK